LVSRACGGGVCSGACAAGFADCNTNKQLDGCEANVLADPDHCGGCTTVCSGNHLAMRNCSNGACSGACDPGFADCNNNRQGDGCETDLSLPASCGGCGQACSAN